MRSGKKSSSHLVCKSVSKRMSSRGMSSSGHRADRVVVVSCRCRYLEELCFRLLVMSYDVGMSALSIGLID